MYCKIDFVDFYITGKKDIMKKHKSLLEKALFFALDVHKENKRKSESSPYVMHPMEAAVIVASMTNDENVMAAALLHDTIEDAGVSAEMLRKNFGDDITGLVLSETENKHNEIPRSESWMIRKTESLELLKNSEDIRVKILWLGDKLSNMRAFYRTFLKEGTSLWNIYNQKDPAKQAWYYRTIAEYTNELSGTVAWKEYVDLIEKVFGGGVE